MLSAQKLLDTARRESGLDDYGDMDFADGLRALVDSINAEAGLLPGHETKLEGELLRVLVNRLRMQHDIAQHPEILDEEVLPPVFITSMPRTGSTKLHRLLAATGDFNALRFWHTYHFARIPGKEDEVPDPRIEAAARYLQWLERRAPLYQQYHPMYVEEAEEELFLLDAGFNSLHRYSAMLNVPSYTQWVLAREGSQVFRFLRQMLQYLQWQHYRGRPHRWVLKTPAMFGNEAALAEVFPGVDFIVTHRHPVAVVPSACALLRGVRSMYNDDDCSAVAGEWTLYGFGELLKGHLRWRESYPADKVLDIRFDDIMRDEIDVLQNIYHFLGMQLGEGARAHVRDWLALDARRGHQPTTATLAEYGLTPAMIEDRFGAYIRRYGDYLAATQ